MDKTTGLTIQEAIQSGKPFRRKGISIRYNAEHPCGAEVPSWQWIIISHDTLGRQLRFYDEQNPEHTDRSRTVNLNADDILATDWEIKQ